MTLPPKLLAFLVSERLAGKYEHGVVALLDGKWVCRCGVPIETLIPHLMELGLWNKNLCQWAWPINWKD